MSKLKMFDNLTGKILNAEDVELAEKVIETRKQKDIWETIDLLVTAWAERTPDEFQAFKVQIKGYRDNLADPKFGQTKEGKDLETRFTVAMPQTLMLMIRTQFKATELPMDKKFFREFVKKYPFFRIPDKT